MIFEAKFKATHEEGLKILTSKQTHQKLPKALTQVKTGNTNNVFFASSKINC